MLTQIDLGRELIVDNFEQLDDVRVSTLLHDNDFLANLPLSCTDGLGEGCAIGGGC